VRVAQLRRAWHMAVGSNGQPVLNAEHFYGALLQSAQKYFAELRKSAALPAAMIRRLEHPTGGAVTVGAVTIPRTYFITGRGGSSDPPFARRI